MIQIFTINGIRLVTHTRDLRSSLILSHLDPSLAMKPTLVLFFHQRTQSTDTFGLKNMAVLLYFMLSSLEMLKHPDQGEGEPRELEESPKGMTVQYQQD